MSLAAGIVLGVLIGWLIEWVIDWVYWRQRAAQAGGEPVGLRAQNDKLRQDVTNAQRTIDHLRAELAQARTARTSSSTTQQIQLPPPAREPAPKAVPAPIVAPEIAPEPAPEATSAPAPVPETTPEPAAVVAPEPVPEPAAVVAPEPVPEPAAVVAPEPVPEPAAVTAPAEQRRDRLSDIHGIGLIFEQRLYRAGVYTFAQLAERAPQDLREIVQAKDWQDVKPEQWIAEARQFADQARRREE